MNFKEKLSILKFPFPQILFTFIDSLTKILTHECVILLTSISYKIATITKCNVTNIMQTFAFLSGYGQ